MAGRIPIRIDMTAMCDVAFLLLIFFMSTTQFKPPEVVPVTLPRSRSEIQVPETGTIILTVSEEGKVYISTEKISDAQEVPKEDLYNAITSWRTRNPAAVVVLRGDKTANFGAVSDLMDALAQAQTLRFNLMTDLREDQSMFGKKE
jgi:biopolymer transport protein ExbD